ncbi:class I SAM-dependent methyltransferase [Corynebacterium capitovis]|uniref:O-methyltransferase n=1 Tax=Corynebacterium capitovis TaxID=131081 RepID=UPI00037354CE
MNSSHDSAFTLMNDFLTGAEADGDTPFHRGLARARADAEENFLSAPGVSLGGLLSILAASGTQGAVAVTPAAGVVGLHILRGLPPKAALTCIDPETVHQSGAREAFREAGFAPARARFLTARPLDVMSRLAPGSYQLVYADVSPVDMSAVLHAAWPLLAPGGTLVLADSLLDGTVADHTRRDRETEAARAAWGDVDKLAAEEGALVAYLPLDGGTTLVTRR